MVQVQARFSREPVAEQAGTASVFSCAFTRAVSWLRSRLARLATVSLYRAARALGGQR
jgi:hypothetical protein